MSQPACRAETNRANAQHSTGPKSAIGKLRSSQNSFQHGLYSKQLILPGEDAAEFDHLRATLRDEHQPANSVEEILVDELAQHFWRMRRFRELEARALQPENLDTWCNNGLFALVQRSMASAERSFHKSLTALSKLQKRTGREPAQPGKSSNSADLDADRESVVRAQEIARGFVPQINAYQAQSGTHHIEYEEEDQAEAGFVTSDSLHVLLETDQEVDFEPLAA